MEKFEYKGVAYQSFTSCCRQLGLDSYTVIAYMRYHNISKEEALELYLYNPPSQCESFVFRGVTYKSFTSCCRRLRINNSTVSKYAKKHNISKEEALEYYLEKKKITILLTN